MMNKLLTKVFIISVFLNIGLFAQNADTVKRDGWKFDTTDTMKSGVPSNLKFFKYFDILPDEINLKMFNGQDLSHLAGKKIYVGYGIADQEGNDCKVFKKEETGQAQDITVCLPWWRIEREYKKKKTNAESMPSFLDGLKTPRAPMTVNYCKEWADGKEYPGGKVSCTTYYDRNAGGDCWDNPQQPECFVDNCGNEIKKRCTFIDIAVGEVTELPTSVMDGANTPTETQTKVKLTSHRYECPAGPIASEVECLDEKQAIMFPYECKEDDVSTVKDDGEYVYCDENQPVYDVTGDIKSFKGECSSGEKIECQVNKFKNTVKVCTQPIYETEIISEIKGTELVRGYQSKVVDVLSGEPDVYAAQDNCLRSNTVEQAREQELYVKIVGNGALDDDIYVLRHKADGSHTKVYCNMQHSESNGNRLSYNGDVLRCIDNNGSYSFNKRVNIDVTDIVTVQQNSENVNANGTPFAIGRNHYGSTQVVIDNIEVAPKTFPNLFPYYPRNGGWMRTWDNTNSTLSILFPFAGAYEIFFYNKYNEEMAKATLDIEDFKEITQNGSMQVKLGRQMELASGITEAKANREDMWVEWGGGVFGGRDSIRGNSVSSPNDAYVKRNAVTNIIVKDLLTGSIVPIPLTYPVAYPNRIFASKLKVYEYRKYRCYDEFVDFNLLGEKSTTRSVCTDTPQWNDYVSGFKTDIGNLQQWYNKGLCEQNCRSFNQCVSATEGSNIGYKCSQRGGENIGGDLNGNLFSSKDECDAQCWNQNECADYTESNCNIVEEQNAEPISDYTGKTLFRKKSVTYKCDTRVDKQTGCAEYDVRVSEGDVDYGFTAVGFETKSYEGSFEEAVAKAQMIEVGQQHIFSGWEGKCVQGMKWDFSYMSDPMTIASYAMSAYSSIDYMADAGVGWAKDMQQGFNDFSNTASKSVSDAMDAVSESIAESAVGESVSSAYKSAYQTVTGEAWTASKEVVAETTKTGTENMGKSFIDEVTQDAKDMLKEHTGVNWDETIKINGTELKVGNYINVTQGSLVEFGVRAAYTMAAPSEQDYITADKLLNGYAGIGTEEPEVHNYNSCMASIGASLPNLIGWSVDSKENTSSQLLFPWASPLRMTPEQLASIATVMGEQFVTSQYMYEETDDILLNVIAINQPAYLKATEVICMGTKVAQAATHIQSTNNKKNNPLKGMLSTQALAQMALSVACPPCGFAATIVMDLSSNVFAKINTCYDEDDAMQWDMLHFKTNKFLNQEQCHYVKTECDKMASFGFKKKCVRQRLEYCCYDQVTTKVFAEGLKEQLDKGWESCNGISVDDLKDVSFRECRPGEIPEINKCFPSDKYSEFKQTLFRQASKNIGTGLADGLVEQAKNSMSFISDK